MSPELQEKMRQITSRNEHAKLEGVPALERLTRIAEGTHGQAHHVRRLLLGLFNSKEWPFELNRLRVLDPDIQTDALRVIALDWCGSEVQKYLDDGDNIMHRYWSWEAS